MTSCSRRHPPVVTCQVRPSSQSHHNPALSLSHVVRFRSDDQRHHGGLVDQFTGSWNKTKLEAGKQNRLMRKNVFLLKPFLSSCPSLLLWSLSVADARGGVRELNDSPPLQGLGGGTPDPETSSTSFPEVKHGTNTIMTRNRWRPEERDCGDSRGASQCQCRHHRSFRPPEGFRVSSL